MASVRMVSFLCCLALVVTACGRAATYAPASSHPSTTISDAATSTTTTTTTGATTSTTEAATTTTTEAGPESTTTTVPHDDQEPNLEWKPPGAFDIRDVSEIDDYYIFLFDVGAESFTTRYAVRGATIPWSVTPERATLRVHGEKMHLSFQEAAGTWELVGAGDEYWGREAGGEWQPSEGLGEFSGLILYIANPDFAYAMAHAASEHLEFSGWTEVDGQRLAVYRGGDMAARFGVEAFGSSDVEGVGGSFEAFWSPDGYFAKVEVSVERPEASYTLTWDVFDLGKTVVQLPG